MSPCPCGPTPMQPTPIRLLGATLPDWVRWPKVANCRKRITATMLLQHTRIMRLMGIADCGESKLRGAQRMAGGGASQSILRLPKDQRTTRSSSYRNYGSYHRFLIITRGNLEMGTKCKNAYFYGVFSRFCEFQERAIFRLKVRCSTRLSYNHRGRKHCVIPGKTRIVNRGQDSTGPG